MAPSSAALAVVPLPAAAPPPGVPPVANDAPRNFLRMVSHELRTPLNSIIGFSEVLGQELHGPLGSPQYREYAGIIRDSGFKLLRMVNQVLEIVRLESGAADLEMRAESLAAATAAVVISLDAEIRAKRLRVIVEHPERMAPVLADGRALRTILTNLLQNAIAFAPEGGEVRVRARAGFSTIVVEVEDDGEGARTEDLPRLLEPFEQGENALTRNTDGAGLGLPIVRLLAQAMGGSVALRSAPGEGFTANVTLLRP